MAAADQRKPEGLTPEELESQVAELPDREALSLVNLGMPVGTPVDAPLEAEYEGPPRIGPPGIDPPAQD